MAKLSLEKYNVPLNGVAHDGYAVMFRYLRQPTRKKPLHELDAEPVRKRQGMVPDLRVACKLGDNGPIQRVLLEIKSVPTQRQADGAWQTKLFKLR